MTGTNPKIILLAMAKGELCDVGATGWTVERNDKNPDLWQFTNMAEPKLSNWIGLGKAVQTYERILKS